ncbi:SPOR domain-containing protein [Parasphingorhabdus sp. JC815]|uniref:SPOR domain-containing protein n=1 Tax=Parasphingorhabdus sp. JC815 TaxID=3232140 RepID=UPI00345B3A71
MGNIKLAHRLLTTFAVLGLTSPALADVKDGVDFWSRGDYNAAVAEWQGLANAGDADAQFNMGQAYKLGRGVPMDLAKAEQYYKSAADQGHLQASDNYGLILFQNQRRKEALPYLQASANRGEPRAQYVLGTGYFNGDFVEKDWVKAYAFITRASAAGLSQATSNMAQMDKHIPLDQRRRGIKLASQMEKSERQTLTAQVGGLRPAASTGAIQTADVPASQTVTPAPTSPSETSSQLGAAPETIKAKPAKPAKPAVTASATKPATKLSTKSAQGRPTTEGKWRVQLGAFSDKKRAEALWEVLGKKVAALNGLQSYLVKAGSITRLQTGPFATKAQASDICTKVKASGNDCIVKSR